MKLLTILGTRPEIIRLSLIIGRLDAWCEQTILHTGQNFLPTLSETFFNGLGVRAPDVRLHAGDSSSLGAQVGSILEGVERCLLDVRPDRVLILGDTNSGLAAFVAKRHGIPVLHLEAGNRCFDDSVPEEVNRRVIDSCSDVLMPYTERSRQNLLAEGFASDRIFVVGNPINEVLIANTEKIERSPILAQLGLETGSYFLVTMHRAENVDVPHRLEALVETLKRLRSEYGATVVVSTHPRTRVRLAEAGLDEVGQGVLMLEPFGFHDFVCLQRNATCILTDSGTVQEEACILGRPVVTLRDVTERPETVECGSNILAGVDPERVLRAVHIATGSERKWAIPVEYGALSVSQTVVNIAIGMLPGRGRASV